MASHFIDSSWEDGVGKTFEFVLAFVSLRFERPCGSMLVSFLLIPRLMAFQLIYIHLHFSESNFCFRLLSHLPIFRSFSKVCHTWRSHHLTIGMGPLGVSNWSLSRIRVCHVLTGLVRDARSGVGPRQLTDVTPGERSFCLAVFLKEKESAIASRMFDVFLDVVLSKQAVRSKRPVPSSPPS